MEKAKEDECLFQPTLPARGATASSGQGISPRLYFNPRSPHGERRDAVDNGIDAIHISTHAPRTGSDHDAPQTKRKGKNFNPRSPHGERRTVVVTVSDGANISTHAPRTGSDFRRPV